MLTFAFVFLSFILFALAGFFAYRQAKQEFTATLKAHKRHAYRKDRERVTMIQGLMVRLEQAETHIKQIANDKKVSLLPGMDVKANMEARAIRENPQIVAVDNVLKQVS